jgi:hypothetical protein
MFASFFFGTGVFLLALGVMFAMLFAIFPVEIRAADDGVAVGVALTLAGVALMLGAIAAAGVH